MRQTAQIKLHQHNSVINTDKTYTYPRIRLRLGPSRANYVTVLPIVIQKFKPKYAEQKLLGLKRYKCTEVTF